MSQIFFKRKTEENIESLDDKFTRISFLITDVCGRWPAIGVSIILLSFWITLGFPMRFSDTWQLFANTPTTWIELFLGLFTLAAANRIQKAQNKQIKDLYDLLKKTEEMIVNQEGMLKILLQDQEQEMKELQRGISIFQPEQEIKQ